MHMGDVIQAVFMPKQTDGGKARLLRRRPGFGAFKHERDDLTMDHLDNGMPSDSAYSAPPDDCA